MTTPTPEQMRALANDLNDVTLTADADIETATDAAVALRAAADQLKAGQAEAAELRAVIENAPHEPNCDTHVIRYDRKRGTGNCNCWKAGELH